MMGAMHSGVEQAFLDDRDGLKQLRERNGQRTISDRFS